MKSTIKLSSSGIIISIFIFLIILYSSPKLVNENHWVSGFLNIRTFTEAHASCTGDIAVTCTNIQCDPDCCVYGTNCYELPCSHFSTESGCSNCGCIWTGPISSCFNLDQPGTTYTLAADIINSATSYCMNISANNVILDCQGHTIDGNDIADYGIYISRTSSQTTNVTVKNCVVSDWYSFNVYILHANGNNFTNINSSSSGVGFYLDTSNNNIITNSTATSNNYGFSLFLSRYNIITNSTATSNGNGFDIAYSGYNNISYSRTQNNTQYGIYLWDAGQNANTIYNNLFNNTNNFYFYGNIYTNYWNTTKQTGTRIYSNGNQIGGNYWTNSTGNGYSDTCTDADTDGFCDSSYTLATDNIDYLPLSNKYTSTSLTGCSNLNQPGATYTLTADITNSATSYCMNISANNVTLDCQGHTIDGNDVASYGIYISRSSSQTTNVTVKNCVVSDWDAANIYLVNANRNNLINITSTSSSGYGFYIGTSNYNTISIPTATSNSLSGFYIHLSYYNTISNSTASSNTEEGFYIRNSNNNNISSSTVTSNFLGFYLLLSNYNTISNSTATSNNQGFRLSSSNNNTISNSTSTSNSGLGFYLSSSTSNNTITSSRIQNNTNYGINIYYSDDVEPNTIYNNLFNNTNNVNFGTTYTDYWNTTNQTGTRIYSNGNQIGGNYWTNSTGNGYSDTCTDTDNDGFCDSSYTIGTNNIDYLPLSNKYSFTSISTCSNLNQPGTTYTLTADIINSTTSPCMEISANNVTLDCQGHTIDGNDVANYSIYISRSSSQTTNVTVKNCVVSDWSVSSINLSYANGNNFINITSTSNPNYGFYLSSSNNNIITKSTSNSNSYGFYLSSSHNNTISSSTANSNSNEGLRLSSSHNNTISSSTANSNSYGLRLSSSHNNTISSSTANSNNDGFFFESSNSSTISNSTANSNSYFGFYMYHSNFNIISNFTANSNGLYGFHLLYSNSSTISNSTANSNILYGFSLSYSNSSTITNFTANSNSQSGFYILSSFYNTISNSKIQNNSYAVYFYLAASNRIYNNLFNNTNNVYFEETIYTNYWNTTKQTGTRIYSNGNQIGGNYWTNSTGNGYSDTCTDADNDGFCDSSYTLNTSNIDYLPLSNKYLLLFKLSTDYIKVQVTTGVANLGKWNTNFSIIQGNNYVLTAYYNDNEENITIGTKVNRSIYVGFFDTTLIGSETTYKDKFQKNYTLP